MTDRTTPDEPVLHVGATYTPRPGCRAKPREICRGTRGDYVWSKPRGGQVSQWNRDQWNRWVSKTGSTVETLPVA